MGLLVFNFYLKHTLCSRLGEEFQKWCDGGGMFHKSAHIDPTARIEFGALVHSESVVGANVSIGPGSIVGPAVTIGQSTTTGYSILFIIKNLI